MMLKMNFKKNISPLFVIWLVFFIVCFSMDWFVTLTGVSILGMRDVYGVSQTEWIEANPIIVGAVETMNLTFPSIFFALYILALVSVAFFVFQIEGFGIKSRTGTERMFFVLKAVSIMYLFYLPVLNIIGFMSWVNGWDMMKILMSTGV